MTATNEMVHFRLLQMPCCRTLICWVNPRRPAYCPECGASIFRYFSRERWAAQQSKAWLRIENRDSATWWLEADNEQARQR